mmetsp:Transcript_25174/g.63890  ORF Transcript_25174/g.63890 Transcript_25174/m.63890 type:complete len:158 (-) Transcript_25174:810-1283(-)
MNQFSLHGPRGLRTAVHTSRQFMKRNPLVAKAIPTAIGFGFGDVLTQVMNRKPGDKYRISRTGQMIAIGAVASVPLLYAWRHFEATLMVGSTNWVKPTTIFLIDQIIGCMFWQAAYLTINPAYRAGAARLLAEAKACWIREAPVQKLKKRLQPVMTA